MIYASIIHILNASALGIINTIGAIQRLMEHLMQVNHFTGANGIESNDVESDEEHPLVSDPNFIPDTTRLAQNDISCFVGEASGMVHTYRQQNKSIVPVIQRQKYDGLSSSEMCKLGNNFLPNNPYTLKSYNSRISCGVYSQDGKYFVAATHGKHLYVYRTHNGRFEPYREFSAQDVGWSVLSVAFSPDNRYIVYSTWAETLYQRDIMEEEDVIGDQLRLQPKERPFCVFSIAFSNDNREIICGANDSYIYIYDREINQKVLEFKGHNKHVNAVIYADDTSQVFYSGSDDGLCKVWDRRMITNTSRAVGIFAGHQDGITYIDSRNDQRYLISNSKDQTIKLWDMRRYSNRTVEQLNWDYRLHRISESVRASTSLLEGDTSVMTYQGHSIRKTLIRCRFSPKVTTGQRYIYTGDSRGRLIIYDLLTGKIVHNVRGHKGCVRDVSWHPYDYNILTSSWDGNLRQWNYQAIMSANIE